MYQGMGSGNRLKGVSITGLGLGAKLMSLEIIVTGPVLFYS